ncbi:uncharacterized protein LOC111375471 isoform X2 [Olea europaea var. sylvestris]|uniref:uncharacterized protein LOC111375471 isoform X2 n=1 Tax=Olea europaea var. sylvestris TaxID=158386 RepID=UPI000C1D0541|nr:uncharacterized protein LOC111375471 isoform X2 [Olea europaea var. sylvestris]
MPQSSRHKSHKHSKHSSKEDKDKDYSDSEEDVKMKEKSSRCDSTRAYRDSASGEKHKISSQARKGKDGKDLSCDGNGEASEEYVSSKRRKEKALLNKERADVSGRVSGDRWDAAGEERGRSDRNLEKEINKVGSTKIDSKLKESNNNGESFRNESKSKSKRHESGTGGDSKEENVVFLVVEKDESKSKRESKRKSERTSSEWREGKELKDKECWLDKDKKGGQESKYGDAEVKAMDGNLDNNQSSKLGDTSADRQCKRGRENTAWDVQDDLRNPELEKELEKRVRRTREGFTDRENDDKRLSSRGDCNKDVKFSDDRHMGGIYGDRYDGDGDRDDRHRNDKHREGADKDLKHRDIKHQEDIYKEARHIDDIYREDGNRDGRCRGEKYREDGERENRCRDDKYREAPERDGRRRNDKYSEDAERGIRDHDDRCREDTGKDGRRYDDRYREDGDKDNRRRDGTYREDIGRHNRHKEEKHWDDIEKYSRHKDRIQGDDCDRDKRHIDSKYGDERGSRDRFGDKSDTKHSRDDGYAGDCHSRKLSTYGDGVSQDDGVVRCRDDQGRRRSDDVEDYGNIKSTQDQRSDAEKKSVGSLRMDALADSGRSTSRNADLQISSSHSRRHSSPSSSFHATREHNRLSNETKYSDYAHEEKIQDKTSTKDYASSSGRAEKISSSRSLEKLGQKDSHLGELSAERHLKSDIRTSSLQSVYKSPSSSADRRHLSKSNVRQSLDIEDSAQCNSGSRDARDYSGKEGRGSREPSMDVPGDELSRADGDTLSVSSPFSRNSHLSSSAKSFLSPPHFRTGMDSRRRRIHDPNVGRVQGNAWRGVPNWPSPVANGFIPFPHMPPPVGFHSMMQPFPVPSIFGGRPSMDLNHSQSLFHMPDADRFSGHGPPMGWSNPVDDSRHLPLHGWSASNAVFGDESHIYERPDWNPSRTLPGGQGWETNGDLWKGPRRTASMERPSSSEKLNNFDQGVDEVSAGQNEQTQRDRLADSAGISQLSDSSEKNAGAEAPHISQEIRGLAKMSRKDDVQFRHVYLSKLDISPDIAEPELFKQWASIIDTDDINSGLENSKILYMEAVETQAVSPGKTSTVPLFDVKNDFVFQKATSHYKRQASVFRVINEEKLSLLSTKVESIPKLNQEELNEENDKFVEEPSPADDMVDIEIGLPNSNEKVEHPNCSPIMEGSSRNLHQKLGVPFIMNITEKSEESPVLDQVNTDVDMDSNLEPHEHIAEKNHLFLDSEGSNTHLLAGIKEVPTESAGNAQELKSGYTKCGTFLNSDVSESCDEIMPVSDESGLVNLSRIHNSPESTH